MPEETTKKPANEQAVSLPGAAVKKPMRGGFGGAAKYVPTAAEIAEGKRIYDEMEKEGGGQ